MLMPMLQMTPQNHLAVNIEPPSLWSTESICYSEKVVWIDAPKTVEVYRTEKTRDEQGVYEGDTGALFWHKMLTKAVRRTWWPSLTSPWANKDTIYGIDKPPSLPHWLHQLPILAIRCAQSNTNILCCCHVYADRTKQFGNVGKSKPTHICKPWPPKFVCKYD